MDKKKVEKLKSVMDSLNDKEYMACIYGEGGDFHFGGYASAKEISECFSAMLFERFDGDSDTSDDFFIKGILEGICDYLEEGGQGRLNVALPLLKSSLHILKDANRIAKVVEHEDCSICPNLSDCELPDAIKYRKANGLDGKAN